MMPAALAYLELNAEFQQFATHDGGCTGRGCCLTPRMLAGTHASGQGKKSEGVNLECTVYHSCVKISRRIGNSIRLLQRSVHFEVRTRLSDLPSLPMVG